MTTFMNRLEFCNLSPLAHVLVIKLDIQQLSKSLYSKRTRLNFIAHALESFEQVVMLLRATASRSQGGRSRKDRQHPLANSGKDIGRFDSLFIGSSRQKNLCSRPHVNDKLTCTALSISRSAFFDLPRMI